MIGERYLLPRVLAFAGQALASMIDQDLPHGIRREREEMGPVLRLHRAAGHLEIRLVHESRRLERPLLIFLGELPAGEHAKVVVDETERALHRGVVALARCAQQLRDLARLGHRSSWATRFAEKRASQG